MDLEKFLKTSGISVKIFAKMCGLTPKTIYSYINRERTPYVETAQRIEKASGGLVNAKELLLEGNTEVKDKKSIYNVSQAAVRCGIGRKAIFKAIKKERLIGTLHKRRWYVTEEALKIYLEGKFSREYSTFEGQPLYDTKKGEISINHFAKLIGSDPAHVYYLLRKKRIQGRKKGGVWVFTHDEAKRIYELKNKREME